MTLVPPFRNGRSVFLYCVQIVASFFMIEVIIKVDGNLTGNLKKTSMAKKVRVMKKQNLYL